MKTMMMVFLAALASQAAGPVVDLKDRIATISDREGKTYENVRLARLDENGLMYFYTNGAGGGRMRVGHISLATQLYLGITNEVAALLYRNHAESEELARQRTAAYYAELAAKGRREQSAALEDLEKNLKEAIGRGKVFEEFAYGAEAVTVKVGTQFALMPASEKTTMLKAALLFGMSKNAKCDWVTIKDIYTDRGLGNYSFAGGLDLKK